MSQVTDFLDISTHLSIFLNMCLGAIGVAVRAPEPILWEFETTPDAIIYILSNWGPLTPISLGWEYHRLRVLRSRDPYIISPVMYRGQLKDHHPTWEFLPTGFKQFLEHAVCNVKHALFEEAHFLNIV